MSVIAKGDEGYVVLLRASVDEEGTYFATPYGEENCGGGGDPHGEIAGTTLSVPPFLRGEWPPGRPPPTGAPGLARVGLGLERRMLCSGDGQDLGELPALPSEEDNGEKSGGGRA